MKRTSILLTFAATLTMLAGDALAWGPANHAEITDQTASTLGYTKTISMHWAFIHYNSVDKTLTDIMKCGGILADINKTLVRQDASGWFTTATGHRLSDATKALLDQADQGQQWADTVRSVALTQFKTSQREYLYAQGWVSHYLADDVEHNDYPGSRTVIKTFLGQSITKLMCAEAFAADTDGGKMPATLFVSHPVWHAVLTSMAAQTGNQELLLIEDADLDRALQDFQTQYISQLNFAWTVRLLCGLGIVPFDRNEYNTYYTRSINEQLNNARGEGILDPRGAGPLPAYH